MFEHKPQCFKFWGALGSLAEEGRLIAWQSTACLQSQGLVRPPCESPGNSQLNAYLFLLPLQKEGSGCGSVAIVLVQQAGRRLWIHTQAPHKTKSRVSYLGPELGTQRQENEEFAVLELEVSLEHIGPCLKLRTAWAIMRPRLRRKKNPRLPFHPFLKQYLGHSCFFIAHLGHRGVPVSSSRVQRKVASLEGNLLDLTLQAVLQRVGGGHHHAHPHT